MFCANFIFQTRSRAVISVGWQSIFGCFIVYPFVHRRNQKANNFWIPSLYSPVLIHIDMNRIF